MEDQWDIETVLKVIGIDSLPVFQKLSPRRFRFRLNVFMFCK